VSVVLAPCGTQLAVVDGAAQLHLFSLGAEGAGAERALNTTTVVGGGGLPVRSLAWWDAQGAMLTLTSGEVVVAALPSLRSLFAGDNESFEPGTVAVRLSDAVALLVEPAAWPALVCVNPNQVYVNPNQVYVNPNQVYVNPNQVYVNPNQAPRLPHADADEAAAAAARALAAASGCVLTLLGCMYVNPNPVCVNPNPVCVNPNPVFVNPAQVEGHHRGGAHAGAALPQLHRKRGVRAGAEPGQAVRAGRGRGVQGEVCSDATRCESLR
jgi:hypothetical protein